MAKRRFHWNPVNDCVTHETDGTGNTLVAYTHEPGQFGPLISETRGGTTSTHHYDAIGSTTMLTNDVGGVTDAFTYDAWGHQVVRAGTTPTCYSWIGRWGYQDDFARSGAYYIRARSYQPTIARWTSVDPRPEIMKSTVYGYSYNMPFVVIDPTGFQGITPCQQDCKTWAQGKQGLSVTVTVNKKQKTCPVNVKCDANCNPAGASLPDANDTITICMNSAMYLTVEMEIIFAHEMQHAKDFCVVPKPRLDKCDVCMRFEKKAHVINCGMVFQAGSQKFNACVACGVWVSCRLSKACTGKDDKPRPDGCTSWAALGLTMPGIDFPFPP